MTNAAKHRAEIVSGPITVDGQRDMEDSGKRIDHPILIKSLNEMPQGTDRFHSFGASQLPEEKPEEKPVEAGPVARTEPWRRPWPSHHSPDPSKPQGVPPDPLSRGNSRCPVENDRLTATISGLTVLIPAISQ